MAWHRVSILPEGALSSRTWRGRSDDGQDGVLREVPDGTVPFTPPSVPGVVPLREVTLVSGRRMTVWDVVPGESLQELLERLAEQGQRVPFGLLARVVIDASRALAGLSPPLPHGGLGDGTLLLSPDGHTWVMDFGSPRPGRFAASGAPSSANDVFAMGGVVHAALTGYGGMYASAVAGGLQLPMPSQFHDECTPLIDDIVARAISRASDKRQPDLDLLADELEAAAGPGLFDHAKVAAFLASHQPKPGPPVAELDPGPFIDDLPTGEHLGPGHDITAAGQPPPRIPLGTQPGSPPKDAFAAVSSTSDTGPLPSIPQATQPGVPSSALAGQPAPTKAARPSAQPPPLAADQPPTRPSRPASPPPFESRPSRPGTPAGPVPSAPAAPRASNPRAPAPKPAAVFEETQPRMNVPPPRAPEPPPNPSAVSHAKLEWAETQTRVPTPPLGTPVASTFDDDDDEDLPTDFASKSDLMGIGDVEDDEAPERTAIRPRPRLEESTGSLPAIDPASSAASMSSVAELSSVADLPSVTDLKAAGSGRRKLIALLLVVIAGMFGLAVWKKQQDSRRIEKVTPVVTPVALVEEDAGEVEAAVEDGVDAGEPSAERDVDAGVDDDDEGDGGDLEDDDGGTEETEVDAGPPDAGVKKKVVKKKPPKRRRRR